MLVSILVLGIIAIESNQIQFKARGVPAAEAADVRDQRSEVRGQRNEEFRFQVSGFRFEGKGHGFARGFRRQMSDFKLSAD
jgi:hypothetical protein